MGPWKCSATWLSLLTVVNSVPLLLALRLERPGGRSYMLFGRLPALVGPVPTLSLVLSMKLVVAVTVTMVLRGMQFPGVYLVGLLLVGVWRRLTLSMLFGPRMLKKLWNTFLVALVWI